MIRIVDRAVVELDVERIRFELRAIDAIDQCIARGDEIFEVGEQKPVLPPVALLWAVVDDQLGDELWRQLGREPLRQRGPCPLASCRIGAFDQDVHGAEPAGVLFDRLQVADRARRLGQQRRQARLELHAGREVPADQDDDQRADE